MTKLKQNELFGLLIVTSIIVALAINLALGVSLFQDFLSLPLESGFILLILSLATGLIK